MKLGILMLIPKAELMKRNVEGLNGLCKSSTMTHHLHQSISRQFHQHFTYEFFV